MAFSDRLPVGWIIQNIERANFQVFWRHPRNHLRGDPGGLPRVAPTISRAVNGPPELSMGGLFRQFGG